MTLTDLEIRSATPEARLKKFSDGGGLQLWLTPDGAKRWRLAYRFDGAQKLLAIGVSIHRLAFARPGTPEKWLPRPILQAR